MLNHFFRKVFALERIYQNKAYSLAIGTPTWSIGTPIWRDHKETVTRLERNPRETRERPKRDDCTPTPSCPKLLQSHYDWLTCPKEGSIQSKQIIGLRVSLRLYKDHKCTSPKTPNSTLKLEVNCFQRRWIVCYSSFIKRGENWCKDWVGTRSLLPMWLDTHRLEWKKTVPVGTLQGEETPMGSLPPGDIERPHSCGLSKRRTQHLLNSPLC